MSIQHIDHVAVATDEAEVDAHAATNAHAPVATGSYHDHVTRRAARRELFRRTKVCRKNLNKTFSCSEQSVL